VQISNPVASVFKCDISIHTFGALHGLSTSAELLVSYSTFSNVCQINFLKTYQCHVNLAHNSSIGEERRHETCYLTHSI